MKRLFNRNFFLLWQGQFVSQLGSQAYAIAMMFWIKHQTGSASLMGLLMTASMLPFVVFGPIAGTVADSYSRRRIIIFSDVFSGIPVLILAGLVVFLPSATSIIIVWLFITAFSLGILRSFFMPAIAAAIPDIVPQEKVSAANSLNQSSNQVSMLVGQALGGYLFVVLGAPLLFLIDGVTYLFSAFSESFIRIPQKIPEKKDIFREKLNQFKADTIEGFRYVFRNAGLRALFLTGAFINFFSIPVIVLMPFYVEDFLHVTPDWYGYILAAFGFGSLLGYATAGILKLSGSVRSKAVIIVLVLMASCLPAFSIITKALYALLLMMALGIFNGFLNINIITILQVGVPSEMRGRMFGLLTTLTSGLTPISMGLSGIVADLINQNIPLMYAFCGGITLLLSILVSFSKNFRIFLQSESTE
jgi:MFS family permease